MQHTFRDRATSFVAGLTLLASAFPVTAHEGLAHESSVELAIITVTECPLAVGKPYKKVGSSTVWVVVEGCKKRPVFNPEVYFSHYTGWDEIAVVDAAVLASIPDHELRFMPWGTRKEYKNGSLVKTVDDPKVYLAIDGKAYPISSEQAFKGLGYEFSKIEDVTADVLAQFQKQAVEVTGADDVPVSLVFKYPSDAKVYVLKSEDGVVVKSHIVDMDTLRGIAKPDCIATLPTVKVFADAKSGETSYLKPGYEYASPDNAAPTVSFTEPAEGATLTGIVRLSATATDDKAVVWVKFKIGDTILGIDDAAPYSVEFDSAKFPNGQATIRVYAGDNQGKYAESTRMVTLSNGAAAPATDNAAPTVSFTEPAAGAAISGTTVHIGAEAADASGIAWVKFKIGDHIIGIDETAPYMVTLDTTKYPNGEVNVTVMAGDKAGKYSAPVTRAFVIH